MTPDERQWSRFTPAQRLGRTISYLVMAAAIVWALRTVAIIPEFLMDAPEQMADLFRRILGRKMHAFDEHIGRQQHITLPVQCHDRRVIADANLHAGIFSDAVLDHIDQTEFA